MKCLILFHSKYGQTEKISHRIESALKSNRYSVVLHDVSYLEELIPIDHFDVVIIGGPIYTGRHSKLLARFIAANLDALNEKTTAFFSVSLSAAGDSRQHTEAFRCLDSFVNQTGWKPTIRQIFAGALPYQKYNFFTRLLMKLVVRKAGGSTDTSKNHEYTDWNKVDSFVLDVIEASDVAFGVDNGPLNLGMKDKSQA